jgi:cation-transporting ATPase 13A1
MYEDATSVTSDSVIQITPLPHRGRPAITTLALSNTGQLQFVFQRQKYDIFLKGQTGHDQGIDDSSIEGKKKAEAAGFADEESMTIIGEGKQNGTVRLIECPIQHVCTDYITSNGLSTKECRVLESKYGKNILAVELPKFLDMWLERLLSPISMFQLFSAALWLLDAYWQYTMMTLVQILILESTTVFQRLKTLKTLKGMSVKAFDVYVYRDEKWLQESTQNLVPGDLISLKLTRPDTAQSTAVVPAGATGTKAPPASSAASIQAAARAKMAAQANNVVPCDCVIVRGSAVVNEATLTGESIPQMKDALGKGSNDSRLNMNAEHRVHTLFSGTTIVATSSGSSNSSGFSSGTGSTSLLKSKETSFNSVTKTPDNGCLCYVLRTGFNSSQGKLVQLIEFSTESVSGDTKETAFALLLLLVFALAASGYVLKKGLEQGDRTTHELMVKCVIILTAVVPRQLPLQMAFAVNQAIIALNGRGIMCTEPFRVPHAGKITHCIFDKTGTLTTDQLLPLGVVNHTRKNATSTDPVQALSQVIDVNGHASMVLGACHSLINVEGIKGIMGDPIELAALKGIQWSYDGNTNTSTPGDWRVAELAAKNAEKELQNNPNNTKLQEKVAILKKTVSERLLISSKSPISSIQIVTRHHFSSKLQRMSVVANVKSNGSEINSGMYCLVKGSPEALKKLMGAGNVPSWYDTTVSDMTHQGYRVLALAYKACASEHTNDNDNTSSNPSTWSREKCESNLKFAGFIAFECKSRADSKLIVRALRDSNHMVAMATGDNALTALHVGKATGICDENKLYLILTCEEKSQNVIWKHVTTHAEEKRPDVPYVVNDIPALALKYSLATTEDALDAASAIDDNIWNHVDVISIFARMSPQGKAKVIRSMQERKGHHVFMCGDGGNDVGALKQANVGLALLSGYGNTNTSGVEGSAGDTGDGSSEGGNAEDVLNKQTELIKKRSARANAVVTDLLNKKRAEFTKKVQGEWLQDALTVRKARGESGMFTYMGAVKDATMRMQLELNKEKQRLSKIHGNVFDSKNGKQSVESMLEEAGGGANDVSIIRPGDASIAAPFTSRQPSIKSAIDLIRQGRCTLLNALQQQQTMMLECIISAYVLSALSLEGSRSSERQLMASSWLIMTASVAFSYATPIDKVSPVRPLKSVFHPGIFISMLGQACVHVFCMWYAVRMSTESMGEERLKEVKQFFKMVRAGETEGLVDDEEQDAMEAMMSMWAKPFLPNLLNTVIFLVETSQIIAVMFVNYKGKILDNFVEELF